MAAAQALEASWFEIGCAFERFSKPEYELAKRADAFRQEMLQAQLRALEKPADPLWSSPIAPVELEFDGRGRCFSLPQSLPVLLRMVRPNGAVGFKGMLPRPWSTPIHPAFGKLDPDEDLEDGLFTLSAMIFDRSICTSNMEIENSAAIRYREFYQRRGLVRPRPILAETAMSAAPLQDAGLRQEAPLP